MRMQPTDHSTHSAQYSRIGLFSTALPLLLFIGLCTLWPQVVRGEIYSVQWPWMPSLDIALRFRLDGLSLLFCLIVTGIGFLVTLFAASYMAGHAHTGRFFVYLQTFMLAMLGIVTADNLLLLFVFWEMTTLFSYLLIGFDHESSTTRDNAKQALLVTGAGGLALLVGILLLKTAGGSLTISHWMAVDHQIRQHPLYLAIFTTFLIGAMTKSAQVPFHFWLPNAMSAPTPISAFLHAATMVKAGIYLLMRLHPLLGDTPVWMASLVLIGGITAIWGAIQALSPSDLKRMLAYTTIMALGILTMFLGGDNTASLTAAATFLLVHALYKAALFLAVGSIDHQTGTRLLDQLGGLWRAMPLTALAVATATMSMAGFPLFFGFIGKEIMYKGALTETVYPGFATTITLLSNALMTGVAGTILLGVFFGKRPTTLAAVREVPWTMRFGPNIMGGLTILFGIFPWWVSANLVQPAVLAFHPAREEIHLKLFHGFNTPLLLSFITLTLGGLIYLNRHHLRVWVGMLRQRLPVTSQRTYQFGLDQFMRTADSVTRGLQNGSLTAYLTVIVLCMAGAVGWPWFGSAKPALSVPALDGPIVAVGLVFLILAATVVVLTAKRRLAAICGLGGVGAGVALIFLVFGAPDLALTQLMVETLTVIIVSLVLLRLPSLNREKKKPLLRRIMTAGLCAAVGFLVTSMLMGIGQSPLDRSLTAFYESKSYLAAHGRNIVNVILVDFRALDTLGEITVVVLAAWAGIALIRKPKERHPCNPSS
jgi:multicomponent Na+:H+ antiporter subunit A